MKFHKRAFILFIASIFTLSACKPPVPDEVKTPKKKEVSVQTVQKQNSVVTKLTASGTVIPKQYASISSLTPGTVEYLAPVGSLVTKGQPLYSIRDSNIENNYLSSSQNFQQTKVITTQRVVQAELSLNSAQARKKLAEANVENIRKQAAQATITAERSAITAFDSAYNVLSQVMNTIAVGPTSERNFVYSSLRVKRPQLMNDAMNVFYVVINNFDKLKTRTDHDTLNDDLNIVHANLSTMKTMIDLLVLIFQNATPGAFFTDEKIAAERSILSAYQIQVNSSLSAVVSAQNSLENTKISNDLQIINAENQLELARIELSNAEVSLENAKESSGLETTIAQSNLNNAAYNYSNLSLPSPFTGTILSHSVSIGQQVRVGEELVEIGNLDSIEVEIDIDIDFAKGLKKGDGAVVDKIYDGIITEIEPAGNIDSGKVGVTVQADNEKSQFSAGRVVVVELELVFEEPDLIIIPMKAVTIDTGGNFVFVVRDGVVMEQTVVLGKVFGSLVSVDFGLEEGDKIILPTGIFVSPGDEVMVRETGSIKVKE